KSPGAHVFKTAGCGGCHTLEAANAKGQVGPNLDELKPDESTVARQARAGGPEAGVVGGGPPGTRGRERDAVLQGAALRLPDLPGRGLRLQRGEELRPGRALHAR